MIGEELVSYELAYWILFYIYFRYNCMSRKDEKFPPFSRRYMFTLEIALRT